MVVGMKTYSMDLRERVVQACDDGHDTQVVVAERFGVSVAWVKKLLLQRRRTGSVAPKPHAGGRKATFRGEKLELLKTLVQQDPDATLAELLERSGVEGSIMAVFRGLERLESRRKKNPSAPPSRTGPT